MEADGSFDLLLSRRRRNNRAMYLFVCFKWLLIDGYEREGGGCHLRSMHMPLPILPIAVTKTKKGKLPASLGGYNFEQVSELFLPKI